ncbi:MAG TPA: RidA family protein [Acidobacteriota bacterium]
MQRLLSALSVAALLSLVAVAATGMPQVSAPAQYLNDPGRTDSNPYSNLVVAGDTVYLAGDIGLDPATGAPPADLEAEIRLVMDRLKARLERVGMSMDDLVAVQVFCPDLTLYGQFNAVYRTYFTDHFPARAFVGSGPLLGGGHFEILGTAIRQ